MTSKVMDSFVFSKVFVLLNKAICVYTKHPPPLNVSVILLYDS
jgi:hypothetical protein